MEVGERIQLVKQTGHQDFDLLVRLPQALRDLALLPGLHCVVVVLVQLRERLFRLFRRHLGRLGLEIHIDLHLANNVVEASAQDAILDALLDRLRRLLCYHWRRLYTSVVR
jgi:hypothetical protein